MRVLYLKEKSRSGDRSYRGGGSRDREIAPTGEVSGESRHWGKLAFMERSPSGDRSYRGGVRRESPLGEVGIYGEVAIGRSLLQGRCQERVAIGGSWHSRSGDRSYRGERVAIGRSLLQGTVGIYGEVAIGRSLLQGRCQERVAIGGSWHLWKSRSGDRSYRGGVRRESPLGEVGIYGEVAIGRSLLQKT